jgi:hypothetical protein
MPLARPPCFAIFRTAYRGVYRMTQDDSHYTPGSMDISAHKRGYESFLTGAKWTLGFVLLIVIFLAVFRTHNG